jgi:putative nucleotidyltransferase with HDIG domain
MKDNLRLQIYSRIDELPTLPAVIPKILGLIESDRSNAADIAGAISHDPALSAKVLKVANSAYYGFSREISSLENAVPLLGFRMVRSLALSLGIIRIFPRGERTPHFTQAGLWIHSVAVGTAARALADQFGRSSPPEQLFTIGILHDVGKLVLDQFFHDRFQQVLTAARAEGLEPHLAEREMIGLDHGEIGAMLLTRWQIPDQVANPIEAHHRQDVPAGTDGADLAILRISDSIAWELALGSEGADSPPPILDADLKMLGMKETDLEKLRGNVIAARDRIYAFFAAMSS